MPRATASTGSTGSRRARQGEIQVKEFDLEQTADVWLFLDLESARPGRQRRRRRASRSAVRAAASIADKSLGENRAVGLTAYGHRMAVLPADRGGRQYLKVMQLLAAVEGDGATPLVEGLLASLPRLRRGMTAVVITPSARPGLGPAAGQPPRRGGSPPSS